MSEKNLKKDNTRQKNDDSQENEGEDGKKGFPSWLKWGLIGLVVVVIAGGAFTLTKYVIMPKYFSHKVNKVLEEKIENEEKEKEKIGFLHYIKGITVNSRGSKGRRFIVAEFALETKKEEVIDELKARDPQIRNDIITFLRRHTVEQTLASSFQLESKIFLRTAINARLNTGEIDSVYYTQLIVQ